jgi:integrase
MTTPSHPPIAHLVERRCRQLDYSERTAECYAGHLVRFERWYGRSVMAATQAEAATWLLEEDERYRRSGIGTPYYLRAALVFLFRHLRGDTVDARVIPSMRRARRREPVWADPQEIAQVIAGCVEDRLRRLCLFLYGTGMRLEEALSVRVADLDFRAGHVVVRQAKGRRQRRTILPDSLARTLRRWCAGRMPEALLFPGPDGGRLCADRLRGQLVTARQRAGVGKAISFHTFRRAFAVHLHERGVGVGELQRLLGHAAILTTGLYLGLRDERREQIARIGDLVADLPGLVAGQRTIDFTCGLPAARRVSPAPARRRCRAAAGSRAGCAGTRRAARDRCPASPDRPRRSRRSGPRRSTPAASSGPASTRPADRRGAAPG